MFYCETRRPLIRLQKVNPTYDNDIKCEDMISQTTDIMKKNLSAKLKADGHTYPTQDGRLSMCAEDGEAVSWGVFARLQR